MFIDFDWPKETKFIVKLSYELFRACDSNGFCCSDELFIKDYGRLFLSDNLNNYLGLQYTVFSKDVFGCLVILFHIERDFVY